MSHRSDSLCVLVLLWHESLVLRNVLPCYLYFCLFCLICLLVFVFFVFFVFGFPAGPDVVEQRAASTHAAPIFGPCGSRKILGISRDIPGDLPGVPREIPRKFP